MKIEYQSGTKFHVRSRAHNLTVDLPPDKGGMDEGMTPTELLAAALGSCIGMYVTIYCEQIGIDPEGTTVNMKWETSEAPLRVGRLHAVVEVPAGIPEGRRAAVKKVAEHCMIHRTLAAMPETEIEIA